MNEKEKAFLPPLFLLQQKLYQKKTVDFFPEVPQAGQPE